jgi:hypothetical protein
VVLYKLITKKAPASIHSSTSTTNNKQIIIYHSVVKRKREREREKGNPVINTDEPGIHYGNGENSSGKETQFLKFILQIENKMEIFRNNCGQWRRETGS